ncbi:MAG: hydroxyisourate hydrolase [Acidobacteriota bacterium]
MMITTRVYDTNRGIAGQRIPVELDVFIQGHGWQEVGHGVTDSHGEIQDFGEQQAAGIYRLMFDIASYLPDAFFPSVAIMFEVHNTEEGYHLPLLLSPFGYSVFRGAVA